MARQRSRAPARGGARGDPCQRTDAVARAFRQSALWPCPAIRRCPGRFDAPSRSATRQWTQREQRASRRLELVRSERGRIAADRPSPGSDGGESNPRRGIARAQRSNAPEQAEHLAKKLSSRKIVLGRNCLVEELFLAGCGSALLLLTSRKSCAATVQSAVA